jgi:integrase
MGRTRKQRRQPHGSAWHWKQTDCWYYTMPGTKQRVALVDEQGQRIRGKENRQAAEMALARVNLANDADPAGSPIGLEGWLVAKVCSEYIQYCQRGVANGTLSESHHMGAVSFLNDLCQYCGALPVMKLKKGHVETWVESHSTWRSPATRRSALAFVLAAFHRAEEMHGIASPLKGLKKPRSLPRLHSFSKEDEQLIYGATEDRFRDFLFAAIHTGLRPFCELARLTADDVEDTQRGMMWRVYASKTKKTRKVPVKAEVAELVRRLMKTAPRGSAIPLFRNTLGKPWKGKTGVTRFLAIKSKLGWDTDPVRRKFSCYTCRHTFAHRMLSGYWNAGVGCSIETLAELIGDTPKVAFDHYGKEWGQHYQDPLWAAIGVGAKGKDRSATVDAASAGTSASGETNRSRRVPSAHSPRPGRTGTARKSAVRQDKPSR